MTELFRKRFLTNKDLADKTFAQLSDEPMFWQPNEESNSVAIIAKHLAGNLLSRWTNFLTEDGEKPWRHRDSEFENDFKTKAEVMEFWEKGCNCFLDAIGQINDDMLDTVIYIRKEPHTLADALLRNTTHFSYHVGQIVTLAKIQKNKDWQTLSVPRNQSEEYNAEMIRKLSSSENQQNSSPVCFAESSEVRREFKD